MEVSTMQLNVLGFYPEAMNILMELAEEGNGIKSFNVLMNMEPEDLERYVPQEEYKVNFYKYHQNEEIINLIGNYAFGVLGSKSKEIVFNYFKDRLNLMKNEFVNLIHPSAVISKTAKLDHGIQIGALSFISSLTQVGFGVNIKKGCKVGHHGKIGDFVTFNPGALMSGFAEIGHNTLIGAGAIIRDGVTIGSNCLIGMGSNVVNDIPDNSVAFGNPCKVVRKNS